MTRRFIRPRQLVVVGLACVVIGAGVGWSLNTVLSPPKNVLQSSPYTTVEVVNGQVGLSIGLNTKAQWASSAAGSNLAVGIVTSVVAQAGDEVKDGAALYSVNLRPTVIGEGNTPSFRALTAGDKGKDVSQLQRMLKKISIYKFDVNGSFDSRTTAAVEAWQRKLAVPVTGTVEPGDVIYVPTLPTRISLDTDIIRKGASVAGGEAVLQGLPAAPTFTVPISAEQASLFPSGTRVEITSPGGSTWEAVAGTQNIDADKGVSVSLTSKGAGAICGTTCDEVPVTGVSLLRSKVVTVETTKGLIVPTSALLTHADGSVAVVDTNDVSHAVKVTASSQGISVVTGVPVGLRVQVPVARD